MFSFLACFSKPTVIYLVVAILYSLTHAHHITNTSGSGTLKISNLSIKLRLEWRKKRISRKSLEAKVPVLKLQELDVKLEKVKLKFSETGFDWLLNKVVSGFSKNISEVVQTNLADQIKNHIHETLDHLNTFVEANPELLFLVLGISIDNLEEDAL